MALLQFSPTPARIIGQASEITDVTWNSINGLITGTVERLPYILAGILVLGIFYIAARLSKGLFWLATRRTKLDQRLKILFSRLIYVFLIVLGVFTAFSVIVPSFSFGNIIAGFGLTSVIIGFATKDIINNLLSGVMILWHKPDVLSEPTPNIFITDISAEGVLITVNFWIDTDKHRPIVAYDQAVAMMLKHLEEAEIDLFPEREDGDAASSKSSASSAS